MENRLCSCMRLLHVCVDVYERTCVQVCSHECHHVWKSQKAALGVSLALQVPPTLLLETGSVTVP